MSNDLTVRNAIPMSDIEKMAKAISNSRLFGCQNFDQAVALMLVAQAEGLHPATAAMDYNIIQGRPALKADAMLARFQRGGGKVEWEEMTDKRVAGNFSHPQGSPKPVLIDWTIERATTAGLTGKAGGMWVKYPRQMMRARVISEGIRATWPAGSVGVYTPEEVEDFEPRVEKKVEAEVIVSVSQEDYAKAVESVILCKTTAEVTKAFTAFASSTKDQKAKDALHAEAEKKYRELKAQEKANG